MTREDALRELRAFQRVPDPEGFLVLGIEVVAFRDDWRTTWAQCLLVADPAETGSTTMLLTQPRKMPGRSGGGKSRAMEE